MPMLLETIPDQFVQGYIAIAMFVKKIVNVDFDHLRIACVVTIAWFPNHQIN